MKTSDINDRNAITEDTETAALSSLPAAIDCHNTTRNDWGAKGGGGDERSDTFNPCTQPNHHLKTITISIIFPSSFFPRRVLSEIFLFPFFFLPLFYTV